MHFNPKFYFSFLMHFISLSLRGKFDRNINLRYVINNIWKLNLNKMFILKKKVTCYRILVITLIHVLPILMHFGTP